MSFSNEHIGGGADGGVFNMYIELPSWMNHEDVGTALVEIDASVQGIKEPPVAKVHSDYPRPAQIDIEDYRRFYVEFEDYATEEDIKAAVQIVSGAIKKLRYADA